MNHNHQVAKAGWVFVSQPPLPVPSLAEWCERYTPKDANPYTICAFLTDTANAFFPPIPARPGAEPSTFSISYYVNWGECSICHGPCENHHYYLDGIKSKDKPFCDKCCRVHWPVSPGVAAIKQAAEDAKKANSKAKPKETKAENKRAIAQAKYDQIMKEKRKV